MSAHNTVCDFRLVLTLSNRADYGEYIAACNERGCDPLHIQAFANAVGMLAVAETMFPDLPLELAYMQLQGMPQVPINVAPSRGLGDTIAKLTSKLGIEPCGGCKKRQELFNELIPYKTRE